MSAPPMAEEPAAASLPPGAPGGTRWPWRALVALAELLGAAGATWLAYWCWPRGIATVTLVLDDGTRLVSTRYYGNWIAAAIALGTVAALLALGAVRQLVLAARGRRRA
ncbi:MAG: hypothetical protein ACJ72N_02840 [Labedaea sp.]